MKKCTIWKLKASQLIPSELIHHGSYWKWKGKLNCYNILNKNWKWYFVGTNITRKSLASVSAVWVPWSWQDNHVEAHSWDQACGGRFQMCRHCQRYGCPQHWQESHRSVRPGSEWWGYSHAKWMLLLHSSVRSCGSDHFTLWKEDLQLYSDRGIWACLSLLKIEKENKEKFGDLVSVR